jgi:hypothetical protein
MHLTIIPVDKAVYEDGICYQNLVLPSSIPANIHVLQWSSDVSEGWLEFKKNLDGSLSGNEPIYELPNWAIECEQLWQDADYLAKNPPVIPPSAEQNKSVASSLLYETDWTTIPDVSDSTKSNPYLMNVQEFLTYRNLVRQIAIAPPEGFVNFPTMPQAQWSS